MHLAAILSSAECISRYFVTKLTKANSTRSSMAYRFRYEARFENVLLISFQALIDQFVRDKVVSYFVIKLKI